MTYFELLFVSWACLGDARLPLIGLSIAPIPAAIRPAVAAVRLGEAPPACRPRPEKEIVLTRAAAERRIKELGPGAVPRLRWCQRFRCWEKRITWGERLEIE